MKCFDELTLPESIQGFSCIMLQQDIKNDKVYAMIHHSEKFGEALTDYSWVEMRDRCNSILNNIGLRTIGIMHMTTKTINQITSSSWALSRPLEGMASDAPIDGVPTTTPQACDILNISIDSCIGRTAPLPGTIRGHI